MNLQENIQRIKQMMGLLTEVTNPYKVEWLEPTQEYFTQELSEFLGNEMRFSKGEFFHPDNFDQMYSLFPHTFEMIAEYSKGKEMESEQEIKEVLLGKEVYELMDDWGEFRHVLMKDSESQNEAFNFFKKGEMKVWKGTDPETGEYIDNTGDTFYMGELGKFMEWEPDYKDTTTGGFAKQYKDLEYKDQLGGYIGNIEQQRDYAREGKTRELPAPFVIKLKSNDREGNEYILIGGHKRSTIALQMVIEPIKVWFIDLTI